jgi:hypothetical protein
MQVSLLISISFYDLIKDFVLECIGGNAGVYLKGVCILFCPLSRVLVLQMQQSQRDLFPNLIYTMKVFLTVSRNNYSIMVNPLLLLQKMYTSAL